MVQDDGGSLEAIAKKYNVGFGPAAGQSRVDPYVPRAGSVLTIPCRRCCPMRRAKGW
ncbi:hypothetical protein KPZU09_23040 [Klebsiella pneumoniae]|uniref:Uncharacterized protein n=1 Tax=Klebsiella pneumoniae TaxID=573 RepID=A0A919HSB8_KLEPN|nr:hypothetical protein KPZU09_23040 [Klebsiella pneumoniae]